MGSDSSGLSWNVPQKSPLETGFSGKERCKVAHPVL